MSKKELMKYPMLTFLGVIFSLAALSSEAQGVEERSLLTGTVLDTNNSVIVGATIIVEGRGPKNPISTTTAEDGTYSIQLSVGIYRISVNKAGFCRARRADFRLRTSNTTIDFTLVVCPIVHSLILEDGKYKGEISRNQPPFKEDEFSIKPSSGSLNLVIQYGERIETEKAIHYKGFALSDRVFGVVASYDLMTLRADRLLFDRKSLRLRAEGNVVFEMGEKRTKALLVEVDLHDGGPKFTFKSQK